MGAFYKVALLGRYSTQRNINILYYRTEIDPFGGLFGVGGAVQLADEIVEQVVPAVLGCKPSQYTLEELQITVVNELFALAYQLPYRRSLNLQGTGATNFLGTDGPGICANIRFNLEPTLFGVQTLTAPKRGYIAVGPLPSQWIPDDGVMLPAVVSDPTAPLKLLADAISKDLGSILPPVDFAPIRVAGRFGGVAGGVGEFGYADVESAEVDTIVSFRRSRKPEH